MIFDVTCYPGNSTGPTTNLSSDPRFEEDSFGEGEMPRWDIVILTCLHPGRLTWNIIMEVWKSIFLSKWVICRSHVNLPGCIVFKIQIYTPLKFNMQPKGHPIEKENHLNQTSMTLGSIFISRV